MRISQAMDHNLTLISTIAASFGLALVFGYLAVRIKLPSLVGYLVAGIVVGPFSPGYVADVQLATQLAEMGVMLLMFGVGLHFSFEDLLSVRRIALPGAIAQILIATLMGMMLSNFWGWSLGAGIVFGLSLSVASTVVLIKALESAEILESMNGRIAVGWLVVEDLVLILVLVLLPPLAVLMGGHSTARVDENTYGMGVTLALTLGKIGLFIVFMLVVGRRLFPWILWKVARTGSRELFTLCVVTAALGIAYGSALLFNVSFALGAFFAGMVLRGSALSYRAAEESLPLRDAFSVLFFVSVGMLFNPRVVIDYPFQVFAVVSIIIFGKSLAAFFIVLLFRYPLKTALIVSASLAQIGEFSFILASLGLSLGLLPQQGQNLILAGAIISIALNPLVFKSINSLQSWIGLRPKLARLLERTGGALAILPATVEPKQVTGHVVLIGYGSVGRNIFQTLSDHHLSILVVDQNRERIEALRANGINAVAGDATEAFVLIQAHIARARYVVVAVPGAFNVRKVMETARTLNPNICAIIRSHSDEEAKLLRKENIGNVFVGEHELAVSMSSHVLKHHDGLEQLKNSVQ